LGSSSAVAADFADTVDKQLAWLGQAPSVPVAKCRSMAIQAGFDLFPCLSEGRKWGVMGWIEDKVVCHFLRVVIGIASQRAV
jgi:hypothetical protein